jgi:hypothetical protein
MRILALLVLVVGFLAVWGGLTPVDPDLDEVCPPIAETQGWTFDAQWWPPGTIRCDVSSGDEVVASKTSFPVRDYLTVLFFGLAVALLSLRPLRLLASFAAFVLGLAVFFGVFDL